LTFLKNIILSPLLYKDTGDFFFPDFKTYSLLSCVFFFLQIN
jgi:hypothetical protein